MSDSEAKTLEVPTIIKDNSPGARVVLRCIIKNVLGSSWRIEYQQLELMPNIYIQNRVNSVLRNNFITDLKKNIKEAEEYQKGKKQLNDPDYSYMISYDVGL